MNAAGVAPAPDDVVVRLRGASIGYAETAVVTGVDLAIHRGEAIAVMGANGSGKTTLIRGVLGLADILAGQVEVFGAQVGQSRTRGLVGYVPQRQSITGAVPATVREVVAVGRLARLGLFGRLRAGDRRAVVDAVDAVGLADRLDDPVRTLSGGQQRRVLIARALAARPEVLVMDEPTAGVDAASQRGLAEVLGRLSAQGATLVVVTHEIGPLAAVVRRAVVVSGGAISYDGPLLGVTAKADEHGHHHHSSGDEGDGLFGRRLDRRRVGALLEIRA